MKDLNLSLAGQIGGDLEEVHAAAGKHDRGEKLRLAAVASLGAGQGNGGLAADERRFVVGGGRRSS
jgi:hypothetical protein